MVSSIVSLLLSVSLASLSNARAKSRDARRKSDLSQLAKAAELYYHNNGVYPLTAGHFSNPCHGGLGPPPSNGCSGLLSPGYMKKIPDDPKGGSAGVGGYGYMYERKDNPGACNGVPENIGKYAFYARLELPSATDLATMSDTYDLCIKATTNPSRNYRVGN